MAIHTTYTQARANFEELLDCVVDDRELAIIRRRNGEDVAAIAADELSGLLKTIHARIQQSQRGKDKQPTIRQRRAKLGLD